MICRSCHQGCWVAVVRSRRFLGGVGVGFLVTLGVGLDLFVRLRLRMSNWIIFYITLLNWEFLLKWYNFFWNFCLKQRFLAVHHDFHWQLIATKLLTAKLHTLYFKERGRKFLKCRRFWKDWSRSRIFYLRLGGKISDSATLVSALAKRKLLSQSDCRYTTDLYPVQGLEPSRFRDSSIHQSKVFLILRS